MNKAIVICGCCRFCTFEEKYKDFVCHNENSELFGKILDADTIKRKGCDDFEGHTYKDMSLKDALHSCCSPQDLAGVYYFSKLPDNNDEEYSYVTLAFKNNHALEEWKDARNRLFMEYMSMISEKEEGNYEVSCSTQGRSKI